MKRTLAPLFSAIFVLLSSPSTFGGEWHSAGNAPMPPYHPTAPANYHCQIIATTSVGAKQYRITPEHTFRNEEFQSGSGAVSFEISNEADPGMNGQAITLRFSPNRDRSENVHLNIRTRIDKGAGETVSSFSQSQAHRALGEIQGKSSLTLLTKRGTKSVSLDVNCVSIK